MANGTPASEFRELTDDELRERLSQAKEELFNLRFQLATGQLTNNRRIYTVLRERELGLSVVPESTGAEA